MAFSGSAGAAAADSAGVGGALQQLLGAHEDAEDEAMMELAIALSLQEDVRGDFGIAMTCFGVWCCSKG